MHVRSNRISTSERQFESGVFDVDYLEQERPKMATEQRKLSAIELERKLRDEEINQRQSRTKRARQSLNQNSDADVKMRETRFGSFSGAGAVNVSDTESERRTSEASVEVTPERKQELQARGMDVNELEEGKQIHLANLDWSKPAEEDKE